MFHRFERAVNDRPDTESDNKKPGIVTSYNMPSLLNIPDAMRRYGPLVNLWEGKNMGEGILHFVKAQMKMGLRPGWQKRLLLRLLCGKALASIMDALGMDDVRGMQLEDDDDEEDDEDASADNKTINTKESGIYHRYKSIADLHGDIGARKPLSLVQLDGGEFRVVIGKLGSPDELVSVSFVEEDGCTSHAGLHYRKWRVGHVVVGVLDSDTVRRSLLLLPYLLAKQEDVYAAVSTAWELMNVDGHFVVPPLLGPEPNR